MNTIKSLWQFLNRLSPIYLGLAVFLLSFCVRVVLVLHFKTFHELSRFELERTALSLAHTGVYGNPYAIPTGPSAHVSPGYTLMLAAIFHWFGDGYRAELIKDLWACATVSFQFALLPWAAASLGFDIRTGLIAGLLCGIYPTKFLMQVDGDWEATYTGIFLIAISVYTARLWRLRERTSAGALVKSGVGHGLLWGFGLLFASVILPIWAACLVVGAYFQRSRLKAYLVFAVVQVAVTVLCLSPWIIRNQRALGAPVATRSNLGIELHVSNNDQATPDQRVNYLLGVYDRYHPLQNRQEAAKVKTLGEVEYNRRVEAEAKRWITTHPQRFLQLTAGRFWDFWFYRDPVSLVKTLFLALTGVLGLIGLIYVIREQLSSGTALLLVMLLYPAPSYLIHVGLRQRYPLDSLLTLLSVILVFAIVGRMTYSDEAKRKTEAAPAASVH